MDLLMCPNCGRTGDDLGQCGSFATCAAPAATLMVPGMDALLECECGIRRGIHARDLVGSAPFDASVVCQRSLEACLCRIVGLAPTSSLPKAEDTMPEPGAPLLDRAKAAGRRARLLKAPVEDKTAIEAPAQDTTEGDTNNGQEDTAEG